MSLAYLKYSISIIALLLIIVHLVWPHIAIDAITLGLFTIAIIPWLAPLFKSLQLPGGVKIEYQDFEKTELKIKKAGLLPEKAETKKYDFLPSPNDNPTLALAWLTIEVEKRLAALANKNKLYAYRNFERNVEILYKKKIINQEEVDALFDLSELLTLAVVDSELIDKSQEKAITEWVIEVGPRLLKGLDNKLKKK